ncbi:MAG: LacI family transcriptional regulator [Anaerolineae bacterium]|nr:LacI family transcriptional regulator [Anaerolineae bacterium]
MTLADVARADGVSAKTVSRVINNTDYVSAETRSQILQAIDQLGYRPNRMARSLASNRSFIIGLVIPDVTNPFFPEIMRGVEHAALERGYNVLVYNADLDDQRERQGLTLLEETRVDGVIVCTMKLADDELRSCLQRHRASVLINRVMPGGPAGIVRVDLFHSMGRVVQHVLDSGRRKIGYLAANRSVMSYSSQQRLWGFEATMKANGLLVDPDYIRSCAAAVEDSLRTARQLLTDHPDIEALICYNDMIAAGALEACAERGIPVPDQVAVTGFDDIMFSSVFKVALTTVHVPKFELGVRAAQMLFERIDGHPTESEVVLNAELLIRQSTGPRRKEV